MANPNPPTDHLKPTQFQPGWQGGPGRPRNDLITRKAIELLEQEHPRIKGKTRLQVHAEKWLDRTEDGTEFTELLDRVDGRMPEKSESTVHVDNDSEPTDEESAAWLEGRLRAERDREERAKKKSGGLCSPDEQGGMEMGSSFGPTE